MKEDIDELVEKLFKTCCFDPDYMSEEFARRRYREALEELTDEEYVHICELMKDVEV